MKVTVKIGPYVGRTGTLKGKSDAGSKDEVWMIYLPSEKLTLPYHPVELKILKEFDITVKCPECSHSYLIAIMQSDLKDYTSNGDGTYTDNEQPFCVPCMERTPSWIENL